MNDFPQMAFQGLNQPGAFQGIGQRIAGVGGSLFQHFDPSQLGIRSGEWGQQAGGILQQLGQNPEFLQLLLGGGGQQGPVPQVMMPNIQGLLGGMFRSPQVPVFGGGLFGRQDERRRA